MVRVPRPRWLWLLAAALAECAWLASLAWLAWRS